MGGKFRLEVAPTSGDPYFELIGSDGAQRWSTRDKIFRVTDTFRSSISFGSRTTPINSLVTTTIGSCNANANFVHGYMKMSSITLQPGGLSPFPAIGDWYYISGTYVGFPGVGSGSDMCAYTFRASGGVLQLEEQLAIYEIGSEIGQTFPFPAFTLDYEIQVGTFS